MIGKHFYNDETKLITDRCIDVLQTTRRANKWPDIKKEKGKVTAFGSGHGWWSRGSVALAKTIRFNDNDIQNYVTLDRRIMTFRWQCCVT
jgi:hypothetical protein